MEKIGGIRGLKRELQKPTYTPDERDIIGKVVQQMTDEVPEKLRALI